MRSSPVTQARPAGPAGLRRAIFERQALGDLLLSLRIRRTRQRKESERFRVFLSRIWSVASHRLDSFVKFFARGRVGGSKQAQCDELALVVLGFRKVLAANIRVQDRRWVVFESNQGPRASRQSVRSISVALTNRCREPMPLPLFSFLSKRPSARRPPTNFRKSIRPLKTGIQGARKPCIARPADAASGLYRQIRVCVISQRRRNTSRASCKSSRGLARSTPSRAPCPAFSAAYPESA